MRNQKGITLVELLAVLAIAGIITVLIASVLTSGTNASQRTGTKQQLQQEANLIVEKIRAHYLLNEKEDGIPNEFLVEVNEEKGELFIKDDTGIVLLSEGFKYNLSSNGTSLSTTLNRTKKSHFYLLIQLKNSRSNELKFEVNTSFSKLN